MKSATKALTGVHPMDHPGTTDCIEHKAPTWFVQPDTPVEIFLSSTQARGGCLYGRVQLDLQAPHALHNSFDPLADQSILIRNNYF